MASIFIARQFDSLVLATGINDTPTPAIKSKIRGILKDLTLDEDSEGEIQADPNIYSLKSPSNVRKEFLLELKTQFQEQFQSQVLSVSKAYAFMKFGSVIENLKLKFPDVNQNDTNNQEDTSKEKKVESTSTSTSTSRTNELMNENSSKLQKSTHEETQFEIKDQTEESKSKIEPTKNSKIDQEVIPEKKSLITPFQNYDNKKDIFLPILDEIQKSDATMTLVKFAQLVDQEKPDRFFYQKFLAKLLIFVVKFSDNIQLFSFVTSAQQACQHLDLIECELLVARVLKYLAQSKMDSSFLNTYQKVKELVNEHK